MVKIKEITPGQAKEKCEKNNSCINCQLNYKKMCILKNTHEQI